MKRNILILFTVIISLAFSQNIPIGTWRSHFSGRLAKTGVVVGDEVFVGCEMGMYSYNMNTQQYKTYSKASGMTANEVNKLAFDSLNNTLIITYTDGNIDLYKDGVFSNIASFYLYDFSGSKSTNHIFVDKGIAFLSTDAGLLLLDVAKKEIKETYSYIGPNATLVSVNFSMLHNDSIFIAGNNGVMAGKYSPTVNLQNFAKWKNFNSTSTILESFSIANFNNELKAIISNKIYKRVNNEFVYDTLLNRYHGSDPLSFYLANDYLFIVYYNKTVGYSFDSNPYRVYPSDGFNEFMFKNGKYFVFSNEYGMGICTDLDVVTGVFTYYYPSSPKFNYSGRIRFFDNKVFVAPGSLQPIDPPFLNYDPGMYFFDNYTWTDVSTPVDGAHYFKAICDIYLKDDTLLLAAVNGLIKMPYNTLTGTLYKKTNSILGRTSGGDFMILSAIEADSKGNVFVTQGFQDKGGYSFYKVSPSLGNDFVGYTQDPANGRLTRKLMIDDYDNKWLTPCKSLSDGSLFTGKGVTVYNEKYAGKYKVLTSEAGKGKLTSDYVNWACKTRNGEVWLATDDGISVIDDPSAIFGNSIPDSRVPVYDSRALLRDKVVNVITTDAANRKWIATAGEGVWLFSANGDSLILQFNTKNSPLPSNTIYDIGVNPINGEVFFATDKGLVSYGGDATEPNGVDDEVVKYPVKVYPNPVLPNFSGTIGLTGLGPNAIVKITDITGKLVYETKANGGMATWDAKDLNGNKVASGVYIVFSATADGQVGMVSKIAVIN